MREGEDFLGAGCGLVLEHHESSQRLAGLAIRKPDDGDFPNGRMPRDGGFHFPQGYGLAGAEDEVLRAADDFQVISAAQHADITRPQPAVAQHACGGFGSSQ